MSHCKAFEVKPSEQQTPHTSTVLYPHSPAPWLGSTHVLAPSCLASASFSGEMSMAVTCGGSKVGHTWGQQEEVNQS